MRPGRVGPTQALGSRQRRSWCAAHRSRPHFSLLFPSLLTHRIVMPIRPENRWLYPIDWEQLSATVRFKRAGSRCERCARPHLRRIAHLGDGRWWDADAGHWRSPRGRRTSPKGGLALSSIRTTKVVLACAHLDHDPGNSTLANLAALCQRCHLLHDAAEHRWQRWWNRFRHRAIRDLYEDPRLTRQRLASGRRVVPGELDAKSRRDDGRDR